MLAVPRGAVPMGALIADALDGELDVVLVHKVGAPSNPEYAIGAVDELGGVLEREDARPVDRRWLAAEEARQIARLRAARRAWAPGREALPVTDRVVILVDDGVATGATLHAAVELVRRGRPRRLVVAVPVAPPHAIARLRQVADEVLCLEERADLLGVGEAYADFRQVSDAEVTATLLRGTTPASSR